MEKKIFGGLIGSCPESQGLNEKAFKQYLAELRQMFKEFLGGLCPEGWWNND